MCLENQNLPDKKRFTLQQVKVDFLKNIIAFRTELKINYKYIFLVNFVLLECYNQYQNYQQLNNLRNQILDDNEQIVEQHQNNLKTQIYLEHVDDLRQWPFFNSFDKLDQQKYLQKKYEYEQSVCRFSIMMPTVMMAGAQYPMITVGIGLGQQLVNNYGIGQYPVYKDSMVELDLNNITDYGLLMLAVISCIRFKL